MKRFLLSCVLILPVYFADTVSAKWVGSALVERVRAHTASHTTSDQYVLQVWFDKEVAPDCNFKNRAAVVTIDPVVLENLRDVALTALLSNRSVEVLTQEGECFDPVTGDRHGNIGVLEYLSIH